MTRRAFLVVLAAMAGGCVAPAHVAEDVPLGPYPADEYAALKPAGTGTGVITGQAFMRTRGGEVKTAAGREVWMMPITSYSENWHTIVYKQHNRPGRADPRHNQFVASTRADGQGRFRFEKVPAGAYFITTTVTWEVPTGNRYAPFSTQGGPMTTRVRVGEGEQIDIIVSP